MEDKLLQTVSDELGKHFNDPIDIECPYCEAAKAVIPLVRADMQREIADYLEINYGIASVATMVEKIRCGTFKEGE